MRSYGRTVAVGLIDCKTGKPFYYLSSLPSMDTMQAKHFTRLLFLIAILLVGAIHYAAAQIEIEPALTSPLTPESLIQEVFAGKGIDITNVRFSGQKESIGYFKNGGSDINLSEGFIMTTGRALLATEPNLSSGAGHTNQSMATDPTLASIVDDGDVKDLAIYEIEFIPKYDTIEFRYVFASEEYPEFGCNCFNDVFGFFLQGPDFPDWTNLAIVPGTVADPVSVKTIHPIDPDGSGSGNNSCTTSSTLPDCDAVNKHLYVDNQGSTTLTYDGLTKVLTAKTRVQKCQPYTIKLAIADVGDDLFDSAVFFEANSFGTEALEVAIETESIDGALIEGCAGGSITFSFDEPVQRDYRVDLSFAGNALRNSDFDIAPLTDVIPAGENSLTLNIRALKDDIIEPLDSIGFVVNLNDCEQQTYWMYIKDSELEGLDLGEDASVCPGDSVQLMGDLGIVLPEEVNFPSTGSNLDINTVDDNGTGPATEPAISSIPVTNVQPLLLREGSIKSVCVQVVHNNIADVDLILESPSGDLLELSSDNGDTGSNYDMTCFTPTATTSITDGMAPFTGDFLPEGSWESLYGGTANGEWKLYIKDDLKGDDGFLLNWSISFNALYGLTYSWTPDAGLSCTDCPNPKAAPADLTTYELAITDSYGCIIRDSILLKTTNDTVPIAINCIEEAQSSITFGWNPTQDVVYEINVDNQGWIAPSGSGAHTITGLEEGQTVAVLLRGAGGCINQTGEGECTTSVCFPPEASISRVINHSCYGADDGRIDLVADDPNVIFIAGGDTIFSKRMIGLAVDTFQILAIDTFTTCSVVLDTFITAPDSLVIDTFQTVANCGMNDGIAAVTPSGGTAPYTYLWDTAAAGDTIKNQGPGTYTVIVTDDRGCTAAQSVTILSDDTPNTVGITINCAEVTSSSISYSWIPVDGVSLYQVQIGDREDWTAPSASTRILVPNLGLLETVQIKVRGSGECIAVLDSMSCTTADCTSPTGTFNVVESGRCADYTDGVLTVGSELQNLVYILDQDTSSNGIFEDLGPGRYSVELLDTITLCSSVIDTLLPNLEPLLIEEFTQAVNCGQQDGIAAVTPSGGVAPYQILWEDGQMTDTIREQGADTYIVIVTDAKGCTVDQLVTISVDDTPTTVGMTITCEEVTSNSISYSWIPVEGVDFYEVQIGDQEEWTTPSADTSILVPNLGLLETVQIKVRGSGECIAVLDSMSCSTANCVIPVGTFDVVRSGRCANYTDGVLSIASEQPNIVYILDQDTSSAGVFEDLVPGRYSVELLDTITLCNSRLDTVLINPEPLIVGQFTQSENCGQQDGIAAVTPMGGVAPYQILWDNVQFTDTLKNLTSENYGVTVIDDRGCAQNLELKVDLNIDNLKDLRVNVSCPTVTNNSIDFVWDEVPTIIDYEININNEGWQQPNGTALLSHELTNLGFSEIFNLQVRGNSDCGGAVIGNQICATRTCIPPTVTIGTPKGVNCYGGTDGELEIVVNTFPFSFVDTTFFRVVDSLGVNVIDFTQITVQTLTAPIGGLVVIGTDTLEATADNPMVTFQDLTPGEYNIHLLDTSLTCRSSIDYIIEEPDSLGIMSQFEGPITCPASDDGVLVTFGLGGTAPYQYNWNEGQYEEEVLNGLAPGTYSLELTDANGCIATDSFVVEPAKSAVEAIFKQNIGCGEENTGAVGIIPDATAIYEINWSNGATSDTISNLAPGMYQGFVTTELGCLDTVEVEIEAVALNLATNTTMPLCGKASDETAVTTATAVVTATGNPDGVYEYEWNDPMRQTTDTAFTLMPGEYIVTVTDISINCAKVDTIFINAPEPLVVNLLDSTEETCPGENDGSVIFLATGGIPNYTVDWGDGINRADTGRNDLAGGNYIVTITDDNGCTETLDFVINAPDSIKVAFNTELITCLTPTGTAEVIATGGSGDFSYSWNDLNSQTEAIAIDLTAAEFQVVVTDEVTGCFVRESVQIEQADSLVLTASSSPNLCEGTATGKAEVVAIGGSGNYLYLWDDELAQETPIAENLPAGAYMVLVLDDQGCEDSIPVTVEDIAVPIVVEFNKQDISCIGDADGSSEVTVAGGSPQYLYDWSTGSTSRRVDDLAIGTYTLTITDQVGCTSTDTLNIIAPNALSGVVEEKNITCTGNLDGAIEISSTGGTGAIQYSIDGNRFSSDSVFSGLRANNYEVVVRDDKGCIQDLGMVSIIEPNELELITEKQVLLNSNDPINLEILVVNGQGELTYNWTSDREPASLACTDCPSPVIDPKFGQTYSVTVTDEQGCSLESTIPVLVRQQRGVFVPTGFSPNTDGINDRLLVHGREGTRVLSFKVFDRWGELVHEKNDFQVNDNDAGWDGTYRGQVLNAGVFTWIAEVQFADGLVELAKGHSTLVR